VIGPNVDVACVPVNPDGIDDQLTVPNEGKLATKPVLIVPTDANNDALVLDQLEAVLLSAAIKIDPDNPELEAIEPDQSADVTPDAEGNANPLTPIASMITPFLRITHPPAVPEPLFKF